MPDTTHPNYDKFVKLWNRVRDACEGEEAIKRGGETYLPKLDEQESDEYGRYKQRAEFFPATPRTVAGFVGMIRRKDPQIAWPDSRAEFLKRVTAKGDSSDELIGRVLRDVTSVGRIGLLVDAPESENAAPFVAVYFAEDITNWEWGVVGGKKIPIRVHLRETFRVPDPDNLPFGRKDKERYRVLRLGLEIPVDGQVVEDSDLSNARPDEVKYWQEVWTQNEGSSGSKKEWVLDRVIVPRRRGGRGFDELPLVVINSIDTGIEPSKPPIVDLVDTNIAHYRNSADLEHGLHLTALPTPWAAGFSLKRGETGGKEGELRLGSLTAWVTENSDARAGMLEFQGTGLGAIAAAMAEKEKRMAVLGGRFLEEQKKSQEAAETVRLRQSGEQATLADVSLSVSDGLTHVFRKLAEWMGIRDDVGVELTRDFQHVGIPPEKITALLMAMQAGAVSWPTFFWNLKQGEAIPSGIDEEDEAGRILEGIPGAQPPVAEPDPEDEPDEEGEEDDEDDEDAIPWRTRFRSWRRSLRSLAEEMV